jgi:hypothetical protein
MAPTSFTLYRYPSRDRFRRLAEAQLANRLILHRSLLCSDWEIRVRVWWWKVKREMKREMRRIGRCR